ncbi:MAG TPA: type I-C CRISPR-associated protein Cas7/Csd2 [Clostridiales bacterium]|nr:type I-C CRISPR-associated protein Cas7/Csd2 [Clostridiales bacterium]
MATLENKIDFVMFFEAIGANVNGDPLNGNMPRTDYDGYGEVSDVCIKRKMRNRMQDLGYPIFVQANDRIVDNLKSLEERFGATFDKKVSDDKVYSMSCEKWMDVRSFGQVMTFQSRSIGIRGPVSIAIAKSLSPIDVISMQITRSTNGMKAKEGASRSSDTMGTKHFVEFGVYKIKGSINPYFAEKTGFTTEDADVIKNALKSLFVNDASSARPDGSMDVKQLYWFTHPSKLGVASSAKVHDLVEISMIDENNKPVKYDDYLIKLKEEKLAILKQKGLQVEIIEGV